MTKEELQDKGSALAVKAHKKGLSSLADAELLILYLYSTWKDGCDWEIIFDMCDEVPTEYYVYRVDLINKYGYRL